MNDLRYLNKGYPTAAYGDYGVEAIYQPLHDWALMLGPGRYEFFTYPVGVNGRTREDTNLYLNGMMPSGNSFYLIGFGVYFVPDWPLQRGRKSDLPDTLRVLSRGAFEFRVQNKVYLHVAPIAALRPDFPLYWARDDKALSELFKERRHHVCGEGVKDKPKEHFFEVAPLLIQPNIPFAATIEFSSQFKLKASGKLGVIAYGFLYRNAT